MRSHIRALDWYRHRWPWITLNGVNCVISPIALHADYVTVVEDRPRAYNVRKISSSSYIWPKLTHAAEQSNGLFATATLLVTFSRVTRLQWCSFCRMQQHGCNQWTMNALVRCKLQTPVVHTRFSEAMTAMTKLSTYPVFTALRGMQRRPIAMRILFVRLSVRLLNASFVTKRKKVVPEFLYHMKGHLP